MYAELLSSSRRLFAMPAVLFDSVVCYHARAVASDLHLPLLKHLFSSSILNKLQQRQENTIGTPVSVADVEKSALHRAAYVLQTLLRMPWGKDERVLCPRDIAPLHVATGVSGVTPICTVVPCVPQ